MIAVQPLIEINIPKEFNFVSFVDSAKSKCIIIL